MILVEQLTMILGRLFDLFFFGPMKNLDVLYILVPVYLNWFVNDYYQERKETDLGNAAANGFTAVWVGIDWMRTMTTRAATSVVKVPIGFSTPFFLVVFKFVIAFLMISYGILIMRYAISGNPIAKKIGRIREVSYFAMVFTPIIYVLVPLDILSLVTILVFFPVFYYFGEILMQSLPAPMTEQSGAPGPARRPQQPPARRPQAPPRQVPRQPQRPAQNGNF